MLVSHRKKFIYTKTAKTAGTSVESYFEQFCVPEGEWTYENNHDMYVSETGIIGFRGGQRPKDTDWFNHMSATRIKRQIGDEIWNSYLKFCVVRDPFDKAVSAFYHFYKYRQAYGTKPKRHSWKQLIKSLFLLDLKFNVISEEFEHWLKSGGMIQDSNAYLINDIFCLDEVIRYENLQDDMRRICEKIGVEFDPTQLPQLKAGLRDKKMSLSEIYTPEAVKIISKLYHYELEHFGYKAPVLKPKGFASRFAYRLARLRRKLKYEGNKAKKGKKKRNKDSFTLDAKSARERRLNYLLTQVTQTFNGSNKPLLVHTYGKVGSTAIHTAVSKLPEFCSLKTHFISEKGIDESRRMNLEHGNDPIHLRLGDALRIAMKKHPRQKVWIVTLVRDPVARAISDLFENAAFIVTEGDITQVPIERVVEIAAKHVMNSINHTEKWLNDELNGVLGFDIFARDFNREQGFEIIREGRFELLVGKLELLSKNGASFLGQFLDLDQDLLIPHARARSSTGEASLYDQVRKNLKLPAALLDQVYASRFCRHFYTAEELEGFRKLWIQS